MNAENRPVALVTGASRGIGRSIAERLAARGMRVALHYRSNHQAAEGAIVGLAGSGHAAFAADFGVASSSESLVAAVMRTFGRIDVLVNNAGIYELLRAGEVDFAAWSSHWSRTISTNLIAPAHLTFLAAREMQPRGGGRIINISSRGAFRGEPNAPAYGAAKAGLNSMGQSLAQVFAAHNIYVFTVAPGWVDTEMASEHLHGARREEILRGIPLGRAAAASEVGSIAAWLAFDAPPSMTGCIIDANGASYLRT